MPLFVALLRAVNVGGYGKLSMAGFRQLLEGLGFRNVQTYIQSGNAVFEAPGTAAKISTTLAAALEKSMGAPVGVMIRTHEQLTRIIDENPFAAEAAEHGGKVHAVFLASQAPTAAEEALQRIVRQYPNRRDRFHFSGDTLYLHLPDGAAETKFSGKPLDRALGVAATARNWNTVLKLHAMSAPEKS